MVINQSLKSIESEHEDTEARAIQDDINLLAHPDEAFGPDKALEKLIAKLRACGLEVNPKKFQVFGTTPDACANKPE